MENTFSTLEINEILKRISKYIKTRNGHVFLNKIKPFSNFDDCVKEINLSIEFNNLYLKLGELPLSSEFNFIESIEKIKQRQILDIDEYKFLHSDLKEVESLIKILKEEVNGFLLIKEKSDKLVNLVDLNRSIEEIFDSNFNIKDDASINLKKIRQGISGAKKNLKDNMVIILNRYKSYLSMNNYAIKDGFYTLPINSSFKSSVKGSVRDISDSGLTTFIEPFEIIDLEANYFSLLIEERKEINNLLLKLNDLIFKYSESLSNNYHIIGFLDFELSKVKYKLEINGTFILPNKNKELNLIDAFHPLLNVENVIKNNFNFNNEKYIMLISGPNAGGKTVAIKTVAIIGYMEKMGLPLSCNIDSKVPFFNNIYVDIGDNQSIEANLSTFSAHMSNISSILNKIRDDDLIVIDEIGAGTNPKEGDSIAIAIIRFLLKKHCISLLTSHYDEVKRFCFNHPNVISASFIFDEVNIKSTYRLISGIGGKSYGFLIAEKYGLQKEVINDAISFYSENLVSEQEKRYENLENKEIQLVNKEDELKKKWENIVFLQNEIENKKKDLQILEERLKEKKLDDLDKYLEEKYNEIDTIYKDFLIDKNLNKAYKKLDKVIEVEEDKTLLVNDFVYIKSFDLKGKIVAKNGNNIEIITESGFKLKTKIANVKKINTPSNKKKEIRNVDNEILNRKVISSSLNLIGYHIDEAINSLGDYLDSCRLAKIKNVKIIHGFGTGKLREAIHKYLKTSLYVASFHLGNEIEGGNGVTIVELK